MRSQEIPSYCLAVIYYLTAFSALTEGWVPMSLPVMTCNDIEIYIRPMTQCYRFSSVTEFVQDLPHNINGIVEDRNQAGALLLLSNYGLDRLNTDTTRTTLVLWNETWRWGMLLVQECMVKVDWQLEFVVRLAVGNLFGLFLISCHRAQNCPHAPAFFYA